MDSKTAQLFLPRGSAPLPSTPQMVHARVCRGAIHRCSIVVLCPLHCYSSQNDVGSQLGFRCFFFFFTSTACQHRTWKYLRNWILFVIRAHIQRIYVCNADWPCVSVHNVGRVHYAAFLPKNFASDSSTLPKCKARVTTGSGYKISKKTNNRKSLQLANIQKFVMRAGWKYFEVTCRRVPHKRFEYFI